MAYHLSNFYTVTIHTELCINAYFDLICTIYVGFISSINSEIEAINKFILYNMEVTQPWVALYEQKRRKGDSDREKIETVEW